MTATSDDVMRAGPATGRDSGAGQGSDRDLMVAALLLVVAGLAMPFLNALVKILSPRYPTFELMWMRYAGHFLIMVLLFMPKHGLGMFRTRRPDLQAARSVFFFGGTLMIFAALPSVALPVATSLQFTAPLMVTAMAPFLLKEKVGRVRITAVVVGFIGTLVVVRPGVQSAGWPELLLLGSAITGALGQILSRKLGQFDKPLTSNTYMVALGFVVTSLVLPFNWVTPQGIADLALLILLGAVGAGGQYAQLRAFELAPAAFVAPFTYLQIIGAGLYGFLIFGQVPDALTWVGAGIIIASGLLILLREQHVRRMTLAGKREGTVMPNVPTDHLS